MSNAVDTVNDITVAAGEGRDETNTEDMILAAALTKQLDAAWAVGTAAGGLNTGVVAGNTWYEVHLIKRTDTSVVDVMFTTTANRATLPTSYTKSRRIGWIRRNGTTILQFTQVSDYITLTTQLNDASFTATATAAAITLTGVAVGDSCHCGPPAAPAANSVIWCYSSAADVVRVRRCNVSVGALADPAGETYRVTCTKF